MIQLYIFCVEFLSAALRISRIQILAFLANRNRADLKECVVGTRLVLNRITKQSESVRHFGKHVCVAPPALKFGNSKPINPFQSSEAGKPFPVAVAKRNDGHV